jgi:hypothetical protein
MAPAHWAKWTVIQSLSWAYSAKTTGLSMTSSRCGWILVAAVATISPSGSAAAAMRIQAVSPPPGRRVSSSVRAFVIVFSVPSVVELCRADGTETRMAGLWGAVQTLTGADGWPVRPGARVSAARRRVGARPVAGDRPRRPVEAALRGRRPPRRRVRRVVRARGRRPGRCRVVRCAARVGVAIAAIGRRSRAGWPRAWRGRGWPRCRPGPPERSRRRGLRRRVPARRRAARPGGVSRRCRGRRCARRRTRGR